MTTRAFYQIQEAGQSGGGYNAGQVPMSGFSSTIAVSYDPPNTQFPEERVTRLSPRDAEIFLAALNDVDAEPNDALKAAALRFGRSAARTRRLRGINRPMPYYDDIIWDLDDDPDGNVQHIAAHGLTKDEVDDVLRGYFDPDVSDSSGRPIVFGWTATGRQIAVVFDDLGDGMVYPVTAYEVSSP